MCGLKLAHACIIRISTLGYIDLIYMMYNNDFTLIKCRFIKIFTKVNDTIIQIEKKMLIIITNSVIAEFDIATTTVYNCYTQ